MKAKIYSIDGKQGKEIEIPKILNGVIREDITQKYYEAVKQYQPYGPYILAGKLASAAGKLSRMRHAWKGTYGKGIARTPRKIMWRRGTQFHWVGATVVNAVKGRRAHPPRIEHFNKENKINKKEKRIAFVSALTATTNPEYIKSRYASLRDLDIKGMPFIVESKLLKLKSKEFYKALELILGKVYSVSQQPKSKRAGVGKMRARTFKQKAGALLVIGTTEEANFSGIDIRKANEIRISDLWPLGRITLFTEEAIRNLATEKENKGDLK